MHVLITAGPTREYIDYVRFLSNASSGRMGYALAETAQQRGWRVSLVSGPVTLDCPPGVDLKRVTSADEMLAACMELLPYADGVIAVAAVSDYRPARRHQGKLHRSDGSLGLDLVPNPDILAEIGRHKTRQWTVGFALDSNDALLRAREKLSAKNCDAIVVNLPATMEREDTQIQILDCSGSIALEFQGPKHIAAERILDWIESELAGRHTPDQ